MSRPKWFKGNKGQSNIMFVVMIAIMAIVVALFVPIINAQGIGGAVSRLEIAGYTVIASADYDALLAKVDANSVKLDDVKTAALAAVVAAQAAADKVDLYNSAEVYNFPTATNTTCIIAAGGTANTFGNWAEIVDSTATTFSSKFAAKGGYLSSLITFAFSVPDEMYIIEIACGPSKHVVARVRVFADWSYNIQIKSREVHAGETVYYRMMAQTGSATCRIGINYFLE